MANVIVKIQWGIALLILCLLPACKPSADNGNPVTTRNKTMILHIMDDPAGLNPVNTVGASTTVLHNLLFDHLIALDPKTLELVPRLAEAMPVVSEDKKTFTFTLREGLQFADGKPLSADDVVFSFKALMNPFVESAPRRAELHNFTDCIALDARTVEFHLKDSGPFNLNRLAINFFVIPKHIYDPNNYTDGYTALQARQGEDYSDTAQVPAKEALLLFAEFFGDEKFQREKGFIVGTGRYVFDGWKSGQSVRLVKNENYWGHNSGLPFDEQGMDTLVYKVIPDIQTAFQALKSGEIDFSDNFDPLQFEELMKGKGYNKFFGRQSVPYPFYEYIGWNQKFKHDPHKLLFADPKVRWALSQGIDVQDIVENVMYSTADPIVSMVYHQRPEYNKSLPFIKYDEEKSKKLLEEAGWADSDGNGVIDKVINGKAVEFSFTLSYKRGNELRKSIARHVQDKFLKLGIKVEPQELDGSVLLERLKKHEVEAWIGGWVYDSDEQDLFSLFHSSQILNEGYNWGSYSNADADSTMEQITKEWDTDTRRALHQKIQKILYDDQPYTLLFANSARMGWNKRLSNTAWYGQRPCYDAGQFHLASGD